MAKNFFNKKMRIKNPKNLFKKAPKIPNLPKIKGMK